MQLFSSAQLSDSARMSSISGSQTRNWRRIRRGNIGFGRVLTSAALFFLAATALYAQTYTVIHDFSVDDGENPLASLVQGLDGSFYGTTSEGATIFKIAPTGTFTKIHTFCSVPDCGDGDDPTAELALGTDGNFYGTTSEGGTSGGGVVFKITPGGTFTALYTFCTVFPCSDGEAPMGGLVQGSDGNFYGTTSAAGAPNGGGTIFRITPKAVLTTLYSFCVQTNCPDGDRPLASLIQGSDGNFYGTTSLGGGSGLGTIFKITSAGVLTTLHSFCTEPDCADGNSPHAALIQGTDGNFYGTTFGGGNSYNGGTVFRLTPTGKLTTLYAFCTENFCPDGDSPVAALIQATDGNFYGTTETGGTGNQGAIFKITSAGAYTLLYSTGGEDGAGPEAAVVQGTNGLLYGTTNTFGGGAEAGTIFSLAVGLGRFVETKPTSAKVGARVFILGNNMAGATAVSFNGSAAAFKVVSPSEITTVVPSNATSGKVVVTTPHGVLKSNLTFRVKP